LVTLRLVALLRLQPVQVIAEIACGPSDSNIIGRIGDNSGNASLAQQHQAVVLSCFDNFDRLRPQRLGECQ
jgi:hypothetical protein